MNFSAAHLIAGGSRVRIDSNPGGNNGLETALLCALLAKIAFRSFRIVYKWCNVTLIVDFGNEYLMDTD